MKFMRRPDLDPKTRIDIALQAMIWQGTYGKMTQIANYYQISRTFLYQLLITVTLHLEIILSDKNQILEQNPLLLEKMILLLRLEGKCSISSISAILKELGYDPNSVGHISKFLNHYGTALPSTLSMPSTKLVFYLSDEIFAIGCPILVTIDAQSTAILKIELASDRSAETWRKHFEDLENHLFIPLGMCSDRGMGVVAGFQAAYETILWVCDQFHEFRDLFKLCHQLERKAYSRISDEEEARQKFENAKSEANLNKRLTQYEIAVKESDRAINIYDQFDIMLRFLRETLQLCSPHRQIRNPEDVKSELSDIFELIEIIDHPAVKSVIKPIKNHLDDILVPFKEAYKVYSELLEKIPKQALDYLCLAWHHDHLSNQSKSKQKHYHQSERDLWLELAEGVLEENFHAFKTMVFEKLDSIVRASSLVEMVNSIIRPYLNNCKGQITQEALNLIMFYHNHRRYKSGKREDKAPIELLTGEPLQSHWVDILIQTVKEKESSKGKLLPQSESQSEFFDILGVSKEDYLKFPEAA